MTLVVIIFIVGKILSFLALISTTEPEIFSNVLSMTTLFVQVFLP